jgi:hypothetical protein
MSEFIKMGDDRCPVCASQLDAVQSIENPEYKPSPKDLTLCVYCAAILVFEDDMALSEFPPVVFDTLDEETKKKLLEGITAIFRLSPPKTRDHHLKRIENLKKYASRVSE